MRIEHVAIQHPDPVAATAWYVKVLNMKTVRVTPGEAKIRFLADSEGRTVLELYNNPAAAVPDYPKMSPLQLHFAFAAEDIDTAVARLVNEGAELVEGTTLTSAGDKLAMLRDPWGVPIQLVERSKPLL